MADSFTHEGNVLNKITNRQAVFLTALFALGGIGLRQSVSYFDIVIPFLIALFASPGFRGRKAVSLISGSISALLFIYIGKETIFGFVRFGKNIYMDTPSAVTASAILLLCLYVCIKGIRPLARSGSLFYFVSAFSVWISCFALIGRMDLYNIYINDNEFYIRFGMVLAAIFAEIVGVSVFIKRFTEKGRFIILKSFCLTILLLIPAWLRNLLVLGEKVMAALPYPGHNAVSLIEAAGFIRRPEAVYSLSLLICVFVRLSICLYSIVVISNSRSFCPSLKTLQR